MRQLFQNPFDREEARYLFCADPILSKTHLETSFNEIVAFLLRRKRTEEAVRVLKNYGVPRRDFQFWMMAGYLQQHIGLSRGSIVEDHDDLQCYQEALKLQPDNEKTLVGYGRALFARELYQEALETYDKLLTINPEKKSYRLNRAVSMTNLGQYAGALKDLYRLNYGYCLWFSGHVDEAADCFHRFLKESGLTREYILENEAALLKEKGITEPEQQLMLYIL